MITAKAKIKVAREYLTQLDFSYIVETMCSAHYFLPRWSFDAAIQCSALYKNFLWLKKIHMKANLVPTREIDEFWHNHILYTERYFHDCEQLFGHYLHHIPASPGEANETLIKDYLNTKTLYLNEFGEPMHLILNAEK